MKHRQRNVCPRRSVAIISVLLGALALLVPFGATAAQPFTEIFPNLPEKLFPCVAVGDFDGDGDLDLAMTRMENSGAFKKAVLVVLAHAVARLPAATKLRPQHHELDHDDQPGHRGRDEPPNHLFAADRQPLLPTAAPVNSQPPKQESL